MFLPSRLPSLCQKCYFSAPSVLSSFSRENYNGDGAPLRIFYGPIQNRKWAFLLFGTFAPGSESTQKGTFAPGSENTGNFRSRKLSLQGIFVPQSENDKRTFAPPYFSLPVEKENVLNFSTLIIVAPGWLHGLNIVHWTPRSPAFFALRSTLTFRPPRLNDR